jgi:methionyl-tRNA formyltransferase
MEPGLDTGPVYLRERTPIGEDETTGDLHDRLSEMGASLLLETLAAFPTRTPEPQAADGVTYAEKIDKAEARIDWSQPAHVIDRQIRGLSPFPGAWTMLQGKRLKLLRSRVTDDSGTPGTVLRDLTIACGTGAVVISELQAEGRGRQGPEEFLRGTPIPPDTILGG